MKKRYIIYFLITNCFSLSQLRQEYFTGMTFLNFCDFVLDQAISFNPQEVKNGSTIFVKTDYLDTFCKNYVPYITAKFVLVTHNSDLSIPGKYKNLLNNEKLIAWFGENAVLQDPKLIGIPIGMVYQNMFGKWVKGKPHDLDDILEIVHQGKIIKNKLLYMNFSTGRGRGRERRYVQSLFKNKNYCYRVSEYGEVPNVAYKKYLLEMAESKFVLSPRGSGWDCYRTWEALIVGSYPIVRHSPIDALYKDLPVLIVTNWSSITPEWLEQKYEEFSHKTWNFEKLYAPYWLNLFQKASESAK